jgi:hypothetical protein
VSSIIKLVGETEDSARRLLLDGATRNAPSLLNAGRSGRTARGFGTALLGYSVGRQSA